MSGVDFTVAHAMRTAAAGLSECANVLRREQTNSLAPLLQWLRSDDPISSSDREYLAELLSGQLTRGRGRPERTKGEIGWRNQVCRRVYALEKQWAAEGQKRPFRKRAAAAVSRELGKTQPPARRASPSQIVSWIRDLPKGTRDLLIKSAE